MKERFLVDAGDTALAGERWHGSGTRVVLLHAGVADRRAWYAVAERLADAHDVVAYDRRGYGETPMPGVAFSDVQDLRVVLRFLGKQPAWLVGNSMGGGVAIDAAVQAPELVAGLVLIAPAVSGWPESAGFEMDDATRRLEERYVRAARSGDVAELQRAAAWLWLDGANQAEGRVRGAPRNLLNDMIAKVARRHEDIGRTKDEPAAWARLETLSIPAVVVCGESDTSLIPVLQEVAKRMPNAEFRLLAGTAHLPMLDQPYVITELVADVIARSPAHTSA